MSFRILISTSMRAEQLTASMPKNEMYSRMRRVVLQIPRGKVASYGAVARAAGYPRAARQVAVALRDSVGLPWHRVVGAGGRILLRGDSGLEQRLRLQAEGVTFRGARVRWAAHEFKFGTKRRDAAVRKR